MSIGEGPSYKCVTYLFSAAAAGGAAAGGAAAGVAVGGGGGAHTVALAAGRADNL